ncbi:DUF397 domain-containing protein [Streptomyces sp. NPDC012600]|uniref:DUF397 domain-containing protein n=1 Tax=Streptomyces stephensoniae TaxID=3375367 RepID=A0ABU2WBB0_9ACTN|nr:DUF397 domain-containing protein [Streptomyces griseus]MDT0495142.1 DUF397 domain-containing protein [Streptomyces griseus]MDT0524523.1 DUF397 domain-containing protein [Streptomyces sp. DSM 41633]
MVSGRRSATDTSTLTGWFKSSYSGGDQGECLEVARGHAAVPVHDSKNPADPLLTFSPQGWSGFITAAKGGAFPA